MNLGGTIRLNKIGVLLAAFLFFLIIFYITSKNNDYSNSVNLRKLLIGGIESAIKGGKIVAQIAKDKDLNTRVKGKTKEGADEPLTKADELSNCAMYNSLTHTFPKVQIVSEEASKDSDCVTLQNLDLDPILLDGLELDDEFVNAKDVTIWIDPLDATVEYTEDLLQYVTTMVCVAVKGVPMIGIIHKPFESEPRTSWAWVGKQVSKNLKIKKENPDEILKVIISRSHTGDAQSKIKAVYGDIEVVPAGGSGYKTLEVAAGNYTLYYHVTDIKKWDICAGNAILNAIGGKMTNLKNELIDYSDSVNVKTHGIIAAVKKHDEFVQKLGVK